MEVFECRVFSGDEVVWDGRCVYIPRVQMVRARDGEAADFTARVCLRAQIEGIEGMEIEVVSRRYFVERAADVFHFDGGFCRMDLDLKDVAN